MRIVLLMLLTSTAVAADPSPKMTIDECEAYAVQAMFETLDRGNETGADILRRAFERKRLARIEPEWQRAAKAAGWLPPMKAGKAKR